MSRFLVVGAGISGVSAAEILAGKGHEVELVESSEIIGGKINGYACKATDSCSRCGVCIANTFLGETVGNSRIKIRTAASIKEVQSNGDINALIEYKNPQIDYSRCTFCDACLNSCPAGCITKSIRGEFTQYIVNHENCLLHRGEACGVCRKNCQPGAVELEGAVSQLRIGADAALIALGHEPYDAGKKVRLGYGRFQGVLTGAEAEEILGRRDYLFKPGEDAAFIQCVGSRDPEAGRNFCSSVCCSYALRLARVLKYRNHDSRVTIYYIDIQNFDKTFTEFRSEMEGMGIEFVRGIPFSVEKGTGDKLKLVVPDIKSEHSLLEHDTVVLSTGIAPSRNRDSIAGLFSLSVNSSGFLSSISQNIFVAGTCSEPLSILDSRIAAQGIALKMIGYSDERIPEELNFGGAFERKTFSLCRNVLVIGGGIAGRNTASALRKRGYPVTLIDKKNNDPESDLPGVDYISKSELISLDGNMGNFEAEIKTPLGTKTLKVGVIVAATGTDGNGHYLLKSENIVGLEDLTANVSVRKKRRETYVTGIILDLERDETRASTEKALETALEIHERERNQVFIFCRDMRVAAPDLEILYHSARDRGVTILKYSESLHVKEAGEGIDIEFEDTCLNERVEIHCDAVGISSGGIQQSADSSLMNLLEITGDVCNQIQENNAHLFPAGTNRPGIFTVGSCRGEHYEPQIIKDAETAAEEIDKLIGSGKLTVELSNAVVDPDKCILCLTCLRSCPSRAIIINRDKGCAESLPDICQKCGICAGECPAKAITLPGFENDVILESIGNAGNE